MLNLSFVFDDAIRALTEHAERLTVSPLPAAVYMMQVDVVNQYRHALDHYLPLSLHEPFLQNSSLGTPYQKWALFTNEDFDALSFAVHNLLRYTSRLVHETECLDLADARRFDERARRSNSYTGPLAQIKHKHKSIGVTVHEDHRISVDSLRIEHSPDQFSQNAVPTARSATCVSRRMSMERSIRD